MKSENRFLVNGKVKVFVQILLMAVLIRITTMSIGTQNINIYSAYIYNTMKMKLSKAFYNNFPTVLSIL